MMKRNIAADLVVMIIAMLLVALLLAPTQAQATGSPPKPDPAPAVTSTAGAKAGAVSSSNAGAKAASGSTSGVGDVSQGLSTGDDRSRFLSLALAPPAFTPPMAAIAGCAARVTQSARSGWVLIGGGSTADSLTDPTDCTLIELRNAKVQACQYGSAKQIEDLLVAKLLPGYVPSAAGDFVDLSRQACAALKAPPVAALQAQILTAQPTPPPAAHKPEQASTVAQTCAAQPARQAARPPLRRARSARNACPP